MPNWCENELTIQIDDSGHPRQRRIRTEALQRFITHAKYQDEFIAAEQFMPIPKKVIKQGGGHEWRIANWGTKWGFCHTNPPQIVSNKKIIYTFDTAWSPPAPLIAHMSGLYPEFIFTLKYWEAGCAFKGIFKVKNRSVLIDKSSNYYGGRGG